MIVYGAGSWMDGDAWDARARPRPVPAGTPVVGGFDGSDVDDWSAIRLQTADGYQFTPTYGPDRRPCIWNPAEHNGQVPRLEVRAAWDEIVETYQLVRAYLDPPDWKTEIDDLAATYGEKVFIRWETYRIAQMHAALLRLHNDVVKDGATFAHDGDPIVATHIRNARKLARSGQKYILGKPSQQQKIDCAMSAALCNEAAGAAGLWMSPRPGCGHKPKSTRPCWCSDSCEGVRCGPLRGREDAARPPAAQGGPGGEPQPGPRGVLRG
jgi:hypothetical protein